MSNFMQTTFQKANNLGQIKAASFHITHSVQALEYKDIMK